MSAPPFPSIREVEAPIEPRQSESLQTEFSRENPIGGADDRKDTSKIKNTVNLRCFHHGNQLGKRKFLSDPSAEADAVLLPGRERKVRQRKGACDELGDEEEAGLSLLFAASLLQQNENTDDHFASANTNAAVLDAVLPSQVPRSIQKDRKTDHTIIQPTDNDVLCGRGGGINRHCGNVIYRRVVEYNKNVYKGVPKRYRQLVSQSIVQAILNAGGRFLQQSKGDSWKEIHFRRAVQKTSQALRERTDEELQLAQAPMSIVKALMDSPTVLQTEPLQEAQLLKIEKVERSDFLEKESQNPTLKNRSTTSCTTTVVVPL
jgi:hypothetical protein